MVTTKPPSPYELHEWSEIEEDFRDADLLLGNGFSINLSNAFHYDSIFKEFCGSIPNDVAERFRRFNTSNFEEIQQSFLEGIRVNEILDIDSTVHQDYVNQLRSGLIETIQRVHPKSSSRDPSVLQNICAQMEHFGDIFTLNYDLYLYDIIMIARDRYERQLRSFRYNDYYWGWREDGDKEFRDTQVYPNYHHVFYIHGALFLHRDEYHTPLKVVSRSGTELIDVIAEGIRKGRMPLFVAEGSAKEKSVAIGRSLYLRFAMKQLESSLKAFVVFGAYLGDTDAHVIDALKKVKRDLAVSIYKGSQTDGDLHKEMLRLTRLLYPNPVKFFDSSTLFQPA